MTIDGTHLVWAELIARAEAAEAANARLSEALDNLVSACELPGDHCEIEQVLPQARAALSTPAEASGWQDMASPPKNGRPVLVFYKNVLGNGRIIKAMYAKRFTIEQSPDCELGEYNEDQECYYLPEGWYECVDNCDEYTWIALEECHVPTHWRPLPASPTGEGN